MPSTELISDLEEEGHNLLGSLHLEAEDEPIRRGAASRANSVRFDESALHGANFSGHGARHSGDFGPIRPGSGMGGHQMMERTYSHKSDGRHSSAGHSVHSMHSGISGRASSLGLDTTFVPGDCEDDSPLDIEPPPVLYILGSPPSIIRCWLTTNFTSDGLLYAVVCTGSQKSTVDYSLLRDLDLVNNIHRDVDGAHRITLPVFLAEARVTQSNSRSASPAPHLPSITASFEVTGMDLQESPESKKAIRIFVGSHTLRMHGADILLSRNLMTLYGSDRDKLSIPFVRPEDDAVFKHLTTANMVPSRPKLNAAAPEFVAGEKPDKRTHQDGREQDISEPKSVDSGSEGLMSPTAPSAQASKAATTSTTSESGGEGEKQSVEHPAEQPHAKENAGTTENNRRESGTAIRTPWRQTAAAGLGDGSTPLSGYQPAARPRSMKVLRPTKPSSSSTRTGAAYEPAPASVTRSSGEHRRKAQQAEQAVAAASWGSSSKRSMSGPALSSLAGGGAESKQAAAANNGQDPAGGKGPPPATATRTANNPLGSASAFSWIKPKTPAAAAD